jgi:hypothetical protein
LPAGPRAGVLATIDAAAREYRELCARRRRARASCAPRASDCWSRAASACRRAVLAAVSRAARRATYVDARKFVVHGRQHGGAAPHLRTTARAHGAASHPLDARASPSCPGFIGQAPDGSVTTLGRGGSDLTATLLGRALGARASCCGRTSPAS